MQAALEAISPLPQRPDRQCGAAVRVCVRLNLLGLEQRPLEHQVLA